MTTLHIDFETRSAADLRVVGLHNYARHPSTSPWCMAWAIDNDEPRLWVPGDPSETYERMLDHVVDGGKVVAHNASFELEIWNVICVERYGFPVLRPEQTYCTMAQAYAMGLPGSLEDAAGAAGLSILKDTIGRALMLKFAKPWRLDPILWMDVCPSFTLGGEKWTGEDGLARLKEYCRQDVRVERALDERLMPLSKTERRVWLMDYAINQRGIKVDLPTAKAAVDIAAVVREKADKEIAKVTNGKVLALTAVEAFKEWLTEQGVPMDSIAKQAVEDMLGEDLPPQVERALLLRQEGGKASVAKLTPMIEIAGADGRVRNTLQYHGAATGRWAGRKIQPHNYPRETPPPAQVEKIFKLLREGNADAIDMLYGPPMSVVSKCLKGFFVPADGHVYVAGDLASVEGCGVAWFSGEQWKIDAFNNAFYHKGPGIYELAYAKAFHVPVESVKNPSFERQVGKVMELAFGYQGGVGAFHSMAKNYGVKVSDAQADEFKVAWRIAHPRVVGTWRLLQRAAVDAVRNIGEKFTAGHPGREVTFKSTGNFLWCMLPSDRVLCYPYPKLLQDDYGPKLTYMTVPSPDDKKKGRVIHDPLNTAWWARVGTYGGSLMENVIQAICRDILAYGVLLPLNDAGARIVLHVHDEGVIEVLREKAEGARKAMEQMMRTPPAWAAGFPLFAKCSILERYGK